jgi:hypothetical protein
MKNFKIFLIIAVLGLAVGACNYEFVVPEEIPEIPVDEDLSFSEVVLPVLTSQCAACHKPGGQVPDLTEANAYQSINTSKYINLGTPGSSLIYSYVAPGASTHKHKQYTSTQAQYILVWIEQGAQNN